MFEGIAKTNTTNTVGEEVGGILMFEGIAKTNTTNTPSSAGYLITMFEGIAKTNTTNTAFADGEITHSLRVLLKQIQQTQPSLENPN